MGKRVVKLLFSAYCLWMLWLLFGQRIGGSTGSTYGQLLAQNLNLIPFKTIVLFVSVLKHSGDAEQIRQAVVNLVGNIVMFVPLGFCLPCIWQGLRRPWRLLACTAGLILAVEILQLVTVLGSCDIDDLILNMLGVLSGYGIWKLSALCRRRRQ